LALAAVIVIACGGPPDVRTPRAELALDPTAAHAAWGRAQQVLESRCVVCHGCYDAPCQLKLGSFEGIERGGSEAVVYDGARAFAVEPTRLGIDAHGRLEWRKKGFHPVLPEGKEVTSQASVLLRMLDLKRRNPLTPGVDIEKTFTLALDRTQTCTSAEHFDAYASKHPLWGMPYALPGVSAEEEGAVTTWVRAGAPHPDLDVEPAELREAIASWERFLDDGSLKGQLVARYIYEHLFFASIRFDDRTPATRYRLVRSTTPSGSAPAEIPTRTPFGDPGVARVHYRFVRRDETALEKTHMPYRLDAARLERFKKLFFVPSYEVEALPGYDGDVASNPFRAFGALPMRSRYRFMLEEAHFTLTGFIKGPVCRGQVAVNVIEDRFWIAFVDPEAAWSQAEADFLATQKLELDLPAEAGKNPLPTLWFRYGASHAAYAARKAELLERVTKGGKGITPEIIWDGDGTNDNAALTVFRHFDNASVVKGFVGSGPPKTAWLIDYPILERIHYLLVAGFDVFGNVGHQLTTRLYMDYLRMAGEASFLSLLPMPRRAALAREWYRGVDGDAKVKILSELVGRSERTGIRYTTKTPEREIFHLIRQRLGSALVDRHDLGRIADLEVRAAFERLASVRGRAASMMPETSFVTVVEGSRVVAHVSLLRDSAHTNVAHLFHENERRAYDEDAIDAVSGLVGAYPNALFQVEKRDVDALVDAIVSMTDASAYVALRRRFGVLRASEGFWKHSDRLNADHVRAAPLEHGIFDYNRLEGL